MRGTVHVTLPFLFVPLLPLLLLCWTDHGRVLGGEILLIGQRGRRFCYGVVMDTKFAWALLWQEFWGLGYTYSSSICGLGARALTSMGVQWLYPQQHERG